MIKLGEPEKYLYPQASPGHGEVLAYCNLEFKHVDRSLFEGLPLPDDREPNRRNAGSFLAVKNGSRLNPLKMRVYIDGFPMPAARYNLVIASAEQKK